MKIKIITLACFVFWGGIIFTPKTFAQLGETKQLDYGQNLILDSDLDGLTDLGEKEIFKTDPLNPDSDGDGFYDGAEVLSGTDSLSNIYPQATKIITENNFPVEKKAAWSWYITRAAGLISFLLLYIVIFLGLSIQTPILKKIIKPLFSLNVHAWLSVQVLVLVFVHALALLFDKFLEFNLVDIIVPFASDFHPPKLAAGILAMYLMIILIISSYLKRFISYKIWRAIHFLNIILYLFSAFHAFNLGTDLAGGIMRNVFIGANLFLIFIIIVNIVLRLVNFLQNKKQVL